MLIVVVAVVVDRLLIDHRSLEVDAVKTKLENKRFPADFLRAPTSKTW